MPENVIITYHLTLSFNLGGWKLLFVIKNRALERKKGRCHKQKNSDVWDVSKLKHLNSLKHWYSFTVKCESENSAITKNAQITIEQLFALAKKYQSVLTCFLDMELLCEYYFCAKVARVEKLNPFCPRSVYKRIFLWHFRYKLLNICKISSCFPKHSFYSLNKQTHVTDRAKWESENKRMY